MTRWRRIATHLARGVGLWVALFACGPQPAPPRAALPAPIQAPAQAAIPPYVRETLGYIRQHGYAPPGFVGGRVFGNYEGALPRYNARRKRIEYREWDVRPRAEGLNRGAERLVTGSDGRAWYTADHYRSFAEVP
jgi:ribonuclease T1